MKMQKLLLIYILSVTILLVFNIILVIVHGKNLTFYTQIINKLQDRIQIDQNQYLNLYSRMFDSYKYDGYKIDLLNVFNNYTISNNHLVVRFPELSCSSCTDSLLFLLFDILTIQDRNNVILLIDNSLVGYMFQMNRLNNTIFPNIIETRNNVNVLPIDYSDLPYFFVLNELGKCSMIYIPNKEKPEETKAYISLIKEKILYQ